jgi:midasin (ATPase involved in ribosome maturation)
LKKKAGKRTGQQVCHKSEIILSSQTQLVDLVKSDFRLNGCRDGQFRHPT